MKRFNVHLPKPPSSNGLFLNLKRGGRAKTEQYKAWIAWAGHELNRQASEKVSGPIRVRIIVDKGRADLANLEKATTDLLVRHKLIDDDRNVVELFMKHSETMGDKCSVTVEQVFA